MNIDWNKERRRARDKEIQEAVTAGVNEALSAVADRLDDQLSKVLAFQLGAEYRHAIRGVRIAIRDVVAASKGVPEPQTAVSRPASGPVTDGPHCGESTCLRGHTDLGRCI